jgi:SAM-dependent methyltransferase
VRPSSPEERQRRAASFNEDPEKYDRARPTYPAALFDRLWVLAGLRESPEIVEVGCGTGQASIALAERGVHLTCVEAGDNMAALAKQNLARFPDVDVVVSKFEEWDPAGRTYDLVFAAASWHWVPSDIRYTHAASVLRPGGHVATAHSQHVYPEGFDPLFIPIQEAYREVTGSAHEVKAHELPAAGEFDHRDLEHVAELERVGGFEAPVVERFLWTFDRTADQFIDLYGTFSDHWVLEPEKRAELFSRIHRIIADSPEGKIRKHYLTSLRVARRV